MRPIEHWEVMTLIVVRLKAKRMSRKQQQEIRKAWSKGFQDLRQKGPESLPLWKAAALYAVASICYDEGNNRSVIEDELFERLCRWLYLNFEQAVAEGADKLDRELLRCGSGIDTTIFVEPYHAIAEVFLGHACHCAKCRAEGGPDDNSRAASSRRPRPHPPNWPTAKQPPRKRQPAPEHRPRTKDRKTKGTGKG